MSLVQHLFKQKITFVMGSLLNYSMPTINCVNLFMSLFLLVF